MKFTFNNTIQFILFLFLIVSCNINALNNMPLNVFDKSRSVTSKLSSPSNLIVNETFENPGNFSSPFETKEMGSWDYAFQYVSDPVFQGKKAARFEIRKDQPLVKKGKRAELAVIKGKNITRNTWYSFEVYFPAIGYEYDKEREVINQWYQNGSPATTIRTQKDGILLESGNEKGSLKQYDLGPILKDTWQEFVLHFIHSYGSDGLVEVWHNGIKVLTVNGGNMYNDKLPKWKIGLYKAAFKKNTSMVSRRIIYFDNVRVGNANATYNDMTSLKHY